MSVKLQEVDDISLYYNEVSIN